MATAAELVHWISTTLGDFPAATNGLWRAGDGRPLQRLAVALAGSEPVAEAALSASVDALLLHRPWGLGPLPDAVAVIAAHEALDARLTTGHNPWLAARLGFTLVSSIGERDGWPLVAVAERGDAMPIAAFWQRLRTEFATWQLWNDHALPTPLRCIALANAMRPALVRGAAAAGQLAGASAAADGASGVHTHMTNTRLTDPEVLEARFPVRVDPPVTDRLRARLSRIYFRQALLRCDQKDREG